MLSARTLQRTPPALNPFRVNFIDEAIGEITGYIGIWGDSQHRDSYETWFDRANPPEMGLEYTPFPLLLEHGTEPGVGVDIIGSVDKVWFDDVGIAFSGHLDQSKRWFQKIKQRIGRGELKTSSGSSSHVAEWDNEGRFVKWLMTELSLTDNPAESRMPSVKLVRSADAQHFVVTTQVAGEQVTHNAGNTAGLSDPFIIPVEGEQPMLNQLPTAQPPAPAQTPARISLQELFPDGNIPPADQLLAALLDSGISAEEIMAYLQQMTPPMPPAAETSSAPAQPPAQTPAPVPAPADPNQAVAEVMRKLMGVVAQRSQRQQQQQQAAPPAQPQPPAQRGGGGFNHQIQVVDKYRHLKPQDMALTYMMLRSKNNLKHVSDPEQVVTPEFMRAMTFKTAIAIEKGDKAANDEAVRSRFVFPDGRPIRANEVQQSTSSGYGDEWVEELQGTAVWESIRLEARIYQEMLSRGMDEAEIPQGFESESIPLEGSDPEFYVNSQSADETADGGTTSTFASSKFGTGQKQVTVAKLSSATKYSRELEEDSIIGISQELNRKLRLKTAEQIEFILINGDTDGTVNTNINLIDGTPNATTTKPSYLLLNGLLKLALVTNTANSRDASTTLDENDYIATMALMPDASIAQLERLMFIVDPATYRATLTIPTLKTRDVFVDPTIEQGRIMNIWGINVFQSGFMYKANSAGKVPAAGGTLGRILCVRPDQWAVRWKRRIQVDVTYYPRNDYTEVTTHMRWGMAYRDNEASAVSYNVNVALQ